MNGTLDDGALPRLRDNRQMTGQRGLRGTLVGKLQAIFSDDAAHVRRYAEQLRAGHYVLGVSVGEDEATKERAADAFCAAGAQSLNYYAETTSRI